VSEKKPAVFVDYAHTPAGVEAAVQEIASRYPSLTVVLGASGNRDQGKRAAMAEAGAKASTLIITDQHPRDEDPAAIRETLVSTAQKIMDSGRLFEISDPEAAIAKAIELTSEDSAVLWCGPGHLKYREISGTKVPFDAIEIARRAVERD
jgi:UDP-N-acetylmuramoyl-L-alanyl-D-glutamate--2,6-diaminopimelate ligase